VLMIPEQDFLSCGAGTVKVIEDIPDWQQLSALPFQPRLLSCC